MKQTCSRTASINIMESNTAPENWLFFEISRAAYAAHSATFE